MHIGDADKQKNILLRFQRAFADGFERGVLAFYQPALAWCLSKRYLCLATLVGGLVLVATFSFTSWTQFIFMPRVQSEQARASLKMPVGTPFEVTDRYIAKITQAAFELKEKYNNDESGEVLVTNIMAATGWGSGIWERSNVGRVYVELVPPEERRSKATSLDFVREWRQAIGAIPGAEELTFRAEIGRVNDPIDVQLSGHDFGTLSAVAEKIKLELAKFPTVFDITDSLSDGKEELRIELKPEAYALGLTRADIINQVRGAFYGFEVQRIQRGREDVRVMVRYPKEERQALENLLDMRISTGEGRTVLLAQVADLHADKSPTSIQRIDRLRTLNVTADLDKKATNMEILQAELKQIIDGIVAQYPDVKYSFEGEAKEQRESFRSLHFGLAFVLFVVYSLLAIPFKSYTQPFIVLLIVPFGLQGAMFGHWVMGIDVTLVSLLGMLALMGVVVNDSLVLVDFVNAQRRKGEAVSSAILNAGVARFRPVILTSLTTFLGLMPLLFEKRLKRSFWCQWRSHLGLGFCLPLLLL